MTGQIYVDTKAPGDLRAAAQGFIAFVTLGVGMFIGSWASGRIVDAFSRGPGAGHAWDSIWMVPAAGAAAVMVLFALFFRAADARPEPVAAVPVALDGSPGSEALGHADRDKKSGRGSRYLARGGRP